MATKPKIDTAKLTADLVEAREAATAKIAGMKDGGTSCFDHPVLHLRLTPRVREAVEAAGFRAETAYGVYKGWVALYSAPGGSFQGTPRTEGARAVAAALEARGWRASVYYAMD